MTFESKIRYGLVFFWIIGFFFGIIYMMALEAIAADRPPMSCPEGYTMVKAEGESFTLCISPPAVEYYISCPDSNYEINCPVEPEIRIKNPDIGGWE